MRTLMDRRTFLQASTFEGAYTLGSKFAGAIPQSTVTKSEQTVSIQTQVVSRPLPHIWEECMGSDRAIVGLREQWLSDLETVKNATGIKSVHFHGLFNDEMGVYPVGAKQPNFLYVDMVFGAMLARGIKPLVYTVAFFFSLGVLLSTVPANLLLMVKPMDGKPPVDGASYWGAPMSWHIAGLLGGAVWCTGAVANFVASGAHLVGPAVSYSFGQGATMISACWGVFVWREFAAAPRAAKVLLLFMSIFFALGLSAVALAPLPRFN